MDKQISNVDKQVRNIRIIFTTHFRAPTELQELYGSSKQLWTLPLTHPATNTRSSLSTTSVTLSCVFVLKIVLGCIVGSAHLVTLQTLPSGENLPAVCDVSVIFTLIPVTRRLESVSTALITLLVTRVRSVKRGTTARLPSRSTAVWHVTVTLLELLEECVTL